MHKGLEDALASSYRLDRELGRGEMATVYLAQDIRHNRRVKGEAPGALTKAIDNGFGHWKWIEHDWTLDSLRDEPESVDLLARKPAEMVA